MEPEFYSKPRRSARCPRRADAARIGIISVIGMTGGRSRCVRGGGTGRLPVENPLFLHGEISRLLRIVILAENMYASKNGKMANYGEGRAWNWVKIADEWYFSDSCYGKNAGGTVMLKGFQDATAPSYLIDASFDDGSFETTKAATDFVFSAGRPTRDSGSVNARDGGTPLR